MEGGQYPKFCRAPSNDLTSEVVLLDGDLEGAGLNYYKIGTLAHSPDHRIGAYAEDRNGSEIYGPKFRDLEQGRTLPETIGNCSADVEWAEDGKTLLYTVLDDNHRPSKVMRHTLGTSSNEDMMIYEEQDPGFLSVWQRRKVGRFC